MIKSKTKSYNDGVVKIYKTENEAEPGRKPKEKSIYKGFFSFSEKTIGVTRNYLAKQANAEIVRLIACPNNRTVSVHDYATIQDVEGGVINRYEIEQIQYPEGVYPKEMILSLKATDWTGDKNV